MVRPTVFRPCSNFDSEIDKYALKSVWSNMNSTPVLHTSILFRKFIYIAPNHKKKNLSIVKLRLYRIKRKTYTSIYIENPANPLWAHIRQQRRGKVPAEPNWTKGWAAICLDLQWELERFGPCCSDWMCLKHFCQTILIPVLFYCQHTVISLLYMFMVATCHVGMISPHLFGFKNLSNVLLKALANHRPWEIQSR